MKRLSTLFAACALALLISSLAACASGPTLQNATPSTPLADLPVNAVGDAPQFQVMTPVPQEVIGAADAEYLLLTNLYERSTMSVVNIEAEMEDEGIFSEMSRGSGFIYDEQGHIITNAHVVRGAQDIRVTFNNGFVTSAALVGTDSYSDVAVIRVGVDAERLHPLPLADSDTVRVGQRAIAIGNPFGLNSSMSAGIVSGLGRTLDSAALIDADAVPAFNNPSIIQTDTPINPGNSGGPLLNSQGEVIGVNTAIRSESGVFQGVGFAVPSNTLRRVVPELIAKGQVDYAYLGISVARISTGALAEPLNLPLEEGVLIDAVTPDSPASDAGLRGGNQPTQVRGISICAGGDLIVAINGQYVRNMDELLAYLVVNSAPGDTITLRVVRDEQTFDVPVTLADRPNQVDTLRCE